MHKKAADRIDVLSGELERLIIARDRIEEAAKEIAKQTTALAGEEDVYLKEGAEELAFYPQDLLELAKNLKNINDVISKVINSWKNLGYKIINVPDDWDSIVKKVPKEEMKRYKEISDWIADYQYDKKAKKYIKNKDFDDIV